MHAFLLAVAAITGSEPQPLASVQGAFFALSVADADATG